MDRCSQTWPFLRRPETMVFNTRLLRFRLAVFVV